MQKILIITLLFLSTAAARAEMTYQLSAPLPVKGGGKAVSTFTDYMQYFVPFLLSVASILALVMFTLGAIEYMFSEGGAGNQGGKDKMTGAIFGILLAVGSVVLLETINPKLVTLTIDLPQLEGTILPDIAEKPAETPEENSCGPRQSGVCPNENEVCVSHGTKTGDFYSCQLKS